MESASPGWYDDGHGALRWWDGRQWTQHVQPPAPRIEASPVVPPRANAAAGRATSPFVWVGVTLGSIFLVGLVLVGLVVGSWIGARIVDASADRDDTSGIAEPSPDPVEPDLVDVRVHPENWDLAGPAVAPENAPQRAALDAVERYQTAWADRDCEAFMQATTPSWRYSVYAEDCAAFAELSAGADEAEDAAAPKVAAFVPVDPSYVVVGLVVQPPDASEPRLAALHVVDFDGSWRVTEVHDLEDGREEWTLRAPEQIEVDRLMGLWEAGFIGGDCAAFLSSTTEQFRQATGLADCDELAEYRMDRVRSCDPTMEEVWRYFYTRTDEHHGEVVVVVEESCESEEASDEESAPWELHLVRDEASAEWRIDHAY